MPSNSGIPDLAMPSSGGCAIEGPSVVAQGPGDGIQPGACRLVSGLETGKCNGQQLAVVAVGHES